ncbi:MAG TPA: cytidylate kinase-like family protein [Prolixibacteraceae bacterium]|nr:cytidylate kinase-like family protein [Prolixibacteraceae bacterium]
MKRFLIKSMKKDSENNGIMESTAGPVITISRECGCSSNRIATKLSKILTGYSYLSDKNKNNIEWRWFNKEFVQKAADELSLSPDAVKSVFLKEARASLHEISTAFSTEKSYDSEDQLVIDYMVGFMRDIAVKGHCIIVGRGANLLVSDIPASLSIRLQAPLEWRINRIMKISNMTYPDARDYVLEIDRQRYLFVEHIAGRELNNNDYDIIYNYSTLSDDMIVDSIINIMKNKKMIIA